MHNSVQKLINIQNSLELKFKNLEISKLPNIIAVSKTFKIEKILPLIEYGHVHFGENKVQEAVEKWTEVKSKNSNIKLHMIGKLQTNKVKFVVKLFDFIHSVDNEKLAKKIAEEQIKIHKKIKIFIQVNIGNEDQKSGINKNKINELITYCKKINLDVVDIENKENRNIQRKAFVGIALALFIYGFIFLYSVQVMRGVIEEKTNRIVEVIISSVSSFELMMAKIIGVGLVGITQFIIWAIVTMIMSITIFPLLIIDKYDPSLQMNSDELVNNSFKIDPNNEAIQFIINEVQWSYLIVFFILFFLGGYLLYSGLMAAIGAAVDEEADTQQFLLPLTIPMVFAILMASKVIDDPSSSLAFWLSEIPFTSPIIMIVRIAMGIGDSSVEIWEIILSLFLLTITFIGTTWLSGRIYRKGILSYGKKASYSDLFKWLKN